MALPLKWMPAAAHGGLFKPPAATFVTVHCTESENAPAMAEALAGPGWFGGTKAGTSSHKVVDVDSICEGVHRNTVAYHAGPGGNTWGIAYEFCGRASWPAAKWREPAQLQMLRNAAPHIADDLIAMTGSRTAALAACRWLSLVQVARHENGLCTHNDVRLALGGTTHTDPGPNFPYAELLSYVAAELGATTTATATEEDEMNSEQAQQLRELHVMMDAFKGGAEAGLFRPFFEAAATNGTTAALRTEGVSGAGDVGRLADILTPILSAKIAQTSNGSPAGTMTKADVSAALHEAFSAAADATK